MSLLRVVVAQMEAAEVLRNHLCSALPPLAHVCSHAQTSPPGTTVAQAVMMKTLVAALGAAACDSLVGGGR